MGWDGTGMNCYGMEWDRKIIYPMEKPAVSKSDRLIKSLNGFSG